MALKAYRDSNKMTSIINAKDVSASNKDDRYYCITPDCKAEFYYRMKNGGEFVTNYSGPKPLSTCMQHKKFRGYQEKFTDTGFDFSSVLDHLSSKRETHAAKERVNHSISSKNYINEKRPPATLLQLYKLFEELPITEKFGKLEVREMLVDARTIDFYKHDISGEKIIEGQIKNYDSTKKTFTFWTPVNSKGYSLKLKIPNDKRFKKIKGFWFEKKDRVFLVAGNIQQGEINIQSDAQFYVFKE